jgi:hypothetical protein
LTPTSRNWKRPEVNVRRDASDASRARRRTFVTTAICLIGAAVSIALLATGRGSSGTAVLLAGHAGAAVTAAPLTPDQQRRVQDARHVLATSAMTAATEIKGGADPAEACARQLSVVNNHLFSLLCVIGELTGGAA